MDWITGLLASEIKNGQIFDVIFIIIDCFNYMVLFLVCQTTIDIVKFVETIYWKVDMCFGPLSNIVNDRDFRIINGF